jgi:PilZ domain
MAYRGTLRTKAVLPVTVRRNNGNKQLAHTLDLTVNSARLAGPFPALEPGEIIEIQRSGARARFQVFWVGMAGGPLAGQAGVRALVLEKNIWRVDLPADKPDTRCNVHQLRGDLPLYRTGAETAERRRHLRLDCGGGASVQAAGCNFPVYTQIADISKSGVYVLATAVFAVKAAVTLRMNIGGFLIEMQGLVRTSDPLVGMGISFEGTSPANHRTLALVLEGLGHDNAMTSPSPTTAAVDILALSTLSAIRDGRDAKSLEPMNALPPSGYAELHADVTQISSSTFEECPLVVGAPLD